MRERKIEEIDGSPIVCSQTYPCSTTFGYHYILLRNPGYKVLQNYLGIDESCYTSAQFETIWFSAIQTTPQLKIYGQGIQPSCATAGSTISFYTDSKGKFLRLWEVRFLDSSNNASLVTNLKGISYSRITGKIGASPCGKCCVKVKLSGLNTNTFQSGGNMFEFTDNIYSCKGCQ